MAKCRMKIAHLNMKLLIDCLLHPTCLYEQARKKQRDTKTRRNLKIKANMTTSQKVVYVNNVSQDHDVGY